MSSAAMIFLGRSVTFFGLFAACGGPAARPPEPATPVVTPQPSLARTARPSVACAGEVDPRLVADAGSGDAAAIAASARRAREANENAEAAILLRDVAIRFPASPEGIGSVEPYLDALNAHAIKSKRLACYDDMARDVPVFLDEYCRAPVRREVADTCTVLTKVQVDLLRLSIQKSGGPDTYAHAGEAYLRIFTTYCVPTLLALGKDEMHCDEIAYNAAMAFDTANRQDRAHEVAQMLLDPRYHLDGSPLAKKLACKLGLRSGCQGQGH
jgi:hypothetical protein